MPTHTTPETGAWRIWLRILLIAVAGNLLLRTLALTVFDIPPEFPPLSIAGPTVFFTVVGVIAAIGVWRLIERTSRRPASLFRTVAGVALLASLVPDAWLLTEGAAEAFPGATLPGVITLMVQHVLAALVVIWMLTGSAKA